MIDQYEKAGYLKEPFRLFHLNDTNSKEMNLHYHDFDKIIIFLGGNVSYLIEGKNYYLEPGDVVLVNRFHLHKPTIDLTKPYHRMVLYISHEFLKQFETKAYDPFRMFKMAADERNYVLRMPGILDGKLGDKIKALEDASASKSYGSSMEAHIAFLDFILALNRMPDEWNEEKDPVAGAVFHQKNIDILNYINEHLTEDISVEELADLFYVSKFHMMRQFKAETGYSIHKYITEKRLIMAKRLLMQDIPVGKVSEMCGFSEYSTFLRAFRARFGITPGDYIKEKRGII